LKILNQRAFKIRILITLEQHIQRFDDDMAESFIGGGEVTRHVDFGITAPAETVLDVIAIIEPALKKT
jgi:hypothetical protein